VREAFNIVDDGDEIAEIIVDLYYNAIVYPLFYVHWPTTPYAA
jgi:hypothetical protein